MQSVYVYLLQLFARFVLKSCGSDIMVDYTYTCINFTETKTKKGNS